MKIFFDLDGTLIDVSRRHHKVYSEITESLGGKPLQKEAYWHLKRSKTTWPEILKASQLSPDLTDNFLSIFISKIEQPEYLQLDTLFPDAIATLENTSTLYQCYLVSLRRNESNLIREVDNLGISKYFKKILSAHSESDGSDKKIELIKAELTQAKGDLIIGDTEADVKTGQALNLTTVAVLSGIRDRQFVEKLKPDHMIQGIGQLPEII
jgi:phosphoglycolate phosphatase-like HAD superfamily hydrolase